MNNLTDELLGIKADKFSVGDLVKSKNTSDPLGNSWMGIVTSVTVLKNQAGKKRNVYTVEWVEEEAKEVLWYDWYDEDLVLIQRSASC